MRKLKNEEIALYIANEMTINGLDVDYYDILDKVRNAIIKYNVKKDEEKNILLEMEEDEITEWKTMMFNGYLNYYHDMLKIWGKRAENLEVNKIYDYFKKRKKELKQILSDQRYTLFEGEEFYRGELKAVEENLLMLRMILEFGGVYL